MAFNSTADVLAAMVARIEGLTPDSQAHEGDGYHAAVALRTNLTGSRTVLLSAQPAIRKLPSRTCTDWLATVEISTYYNDVPTDPDEPTVLARAIADAEQVLDDLYTWATQADGIVELDADLGNVADDGHGEIMVTRTMRIIYTRG